MVEDGFIVNGAYSFDVLPSHQTHFMKDVRLFYCYVELFGGGRKHLISICTGKSLSEALIFASINPQYDNRLFMELP